MVKFIWSNIIVYDECKSKSRLCEIFQIMSLVYRIRLSNVKQRSEPRNQYSNGQFYQCL